ncbi:MAG: PAS sensor histidine kinase [uncultured archaeon A07HR60]|nr:MAG: PAS sensor histidine kinase [uncultured archaeon A07HR60]
MDLIDCLLTETGFEQRRQRLVTRYELDNVATDRPLPAEISEQLGTRDSVLTTRIRQFDTASVGITLSGPSYRDNPILYATETFRDFTGYPLRELQGRNPRLLQGPDTEADAVNTLHEAIDIWERATVELWNYRRDGTRFRTRITVVPVPDSNGVINNWLGLQTTLEQ